MCQGISLVDLISLEIPTPAPYLYFHMGLFFPISGPEEARDLTRRIMAAADLTDDPKRYRQVAVLRLVQHKMQKKPAVTLVYDFEGDPSLGVILLRLGRTPARIRRFEDLGLKPIGFQLLTSGPLWLRGTIRAHRRFVSLLRDVGFKFTIWDDPGDNSGRLVSQTTPLKYGLMGV